MAAFPINLSVAPHGGLDHAWPPWVPLGAETAEYYAKYRRRYPDAIVDAVGRSSPLDSGDAVIDLGCGTGLLTQPLARRVRIVLGVDPEADMLAVATTDEELNPKLVWVLGSDADLPTIGKLVGEQALGHC